MARYYFDYLSAGQKLDDAEGQEFAMPEDAHREGIRIVSELAVDALHEHEFPLKLSITVRGATERHVAIELTMDHVRH
jgi:hypothetical protein